MVIREHGAVLPPRAPQDGTHRRLLEMALARFAVSGYHGVSIREIAAASGVRASSVYSHLSSKEELLSELMMLGHEEWICSLRAAYADAGPDPVAQLDALVRAHARHHATYPLLAVVSANDLHALGSEPAKQVFALRNEGGAMFLSVLDRGAAEGRLIVDDPLTTMMAIVSVGASITLFFGGRPIEGSDRSHAAAEVAAWASALRPYRIDEAVDYVADLTSRMVLAHTN